VRVSRMVASRAGAIRPTANAQSAAYRIFPVARPGSLAAAYVIGIPTDGLSDCRVPTVLHAPGADTRP